jgi:hypothetical protein
MAGDEAKKQKEREQEEKNAIGAEEERQQAEGKDVLEDDARGECNGSAGARRLPSHSSGSLHTPCAGGCGRAPAV